MTKDFPTNEVEQIDALLHLNANGSLTSPVPGLAAELLKKYRAHLSAPAQSLQVSRKTIAGAIAHDLENGSAHGARVATSPYLDNYHIDGHVNLLALADAVIAAQPPAAPVETRDAVDVLGDPQGHCDAPRPQCSAATGAAKSAGDLVRIWRGWANALRLMSKRSEPKPEAQAQADAYEQCATELREALSVIEPQAAGMRAALELCADVLRVVQEVDNVPESPIINIALEQAAAALAGEPQAAQVPELVEMLEDANVVNGASTITGVMLSEPKGAVVTDEMIVACVKAADGYGVEKGSHLWDVTKRGLEAALSLPRPEHS